MTINVTKDFSAKTIKALATKGIRIIGIQAVPAFEGDVYFTGTAYRLDDNGTGRVHTHREVLATAEGR